MIRANRSTSADAGTIQTPRLTAEKMIDDILGDKWVSDYQEGHNGQKPVVIVGFVTNKSTEHIDAETFVKDVEQSFIKSGRVRLVQGGKKREELRAEKADQQTQCFYFQYEEVWSGTRRRFYPAGLH